MLYSPCIYVHTYLCKHMCYEFSTTVRAEFKLSFNCWSCTVLFELMNEMLFTGFATYAHRPLEKL